MANVSATVGSVPVTIHGFSVNSAILTIIAGAALTILGYMAKAWPQLRLAGNARRKDDMDGLRNDLRIIKEEARRAADKAQQLQNIVSCIMPAMTLLLAEVRRLDPNPDNFAVMEAQRLMELAAAGDFGFGKAMMGLATIKGTNE